MFRLTKGRHMKPYLHAFSPGSRPSEKGMLYRNSYMNAHARVATVQQSQRTNKERLQFMILLLPDQFLLGCTVLVTGIIGMLMSSRQMPYSSNMPKNRWVAGGLSQHEQYERNDSMSKIFAMHKEAIDNTRSEIERPEVFSAPAGFHSPSGVYS